VLVNEKMERRKTNRVLGGEKRGLLHWQNLRGRRSLVATWEEQVINPLFQEGPSRELGKLKRGVVRAEKR